MRKIAKGLGIVLVLVVVLPMVLCLGLGLLPAASDSVLPPEQIIVGAQNNGESALAVEWPPLIEPADNQSNAEKIRLGEMLFFDPILSTENDISCATCHHPDLGFTDGRATAMGAGGTGVSIDRTGGSELTRNVPTLYEVAYAPALFWDGRAESLEAQIHAPLTEVSEMHSTADEAITEVATIETYRELFEAAFPEDANPMTYDNLARAVAAYERSLMAHDSPFDRYVAGDTSALTPSQKRGFALFRSGATGCYKCHAAPLFTNGEYAVTGVLNADGQLDSDVGRFAVTNNEEDKFAFRTPSLRNIGWTAPYMHNGSLATLEEVVAFYAKGGGVGLGVEVPNQSRFINPFDLSEQETQDLVNFLYALTDATPPTVPAQVPSGLPVVARLQNPATETIQAINVGGVASEERDPMTLRVTGGATIQSVVDQARDGDTIEIEYGTYHERVVIDQNDLTVRGIPNAAGEYPVLDGEMKFSDGISATGNNFTIEQMAVKNYNGNGIIVDGAVGVTIRDIYVENTSLYGVYPVHSTDVLVERVEATKIRDAGVYAGQCRDVILRNNNVYGNVIGIEIENSIGSELYDNHAYNNSTGIFVDLLPQLDSKVSLQTKVYDNIIEDNNLPNFSLEGEIGDLVPEGTGILVLGGDEVEITNNTIINNRTVGVAVFSTAIGFEELDIGPNPERVHVHNNQYTNNGYDPADDLKELGIPGADIVWDISNWDNRFDEPNATSFPPVIPNSQWPDVVRKGYWQALNFVVQQLL